MRWTRGFGDLASSIGSRENERPGLIMGEEAGNKTPRVGTAEFLCGIGTSAMNDTAVVQEQIRGL